MLDRLIKPYKGLSKEIWYIAFITLINRAGAMVIPFLSLYLTTNLHFSKDQIGWIMTAFGLGSALGTFTGGRLTDRIGYLRVMISSLILTGFIFYGLQYLETFWEIAVGIFILSFTADSYRPAIWVALDDNSRKENRTRSVTLIRLAINLGFAVGPAVGGLIIASLDYSSLFWIDGSTCLIAGILLWKLIKPKNLLNVGESRSELNINKSPYSDWPYIIFAISIMLMGMTFMQFMSTMPVYFNQVIHMSEQQIGFLIALNGLLIFLIEMPLVHYIEMKNKNPLKITLIGSLFFIITFLVLNISVNIIFPILAIIFLTVEMISFPFSNAFALDRAQNGKKGAYMAMFSLTFSFANLFGPNLGFHLSDAFGFRATWFIMAVVMFFSLSLMFFLVSFLEKRKL